MNEIIIFKELKGIATNSMVDIKDLNFKIQWRWLKKTGNQTLCKINRAC